MKLDNIVSEETNLAQESPSIVDPKLTSITQISYIPIVNPELTSISKPKCNRYNWTNYF